VIWALFVATALWFPFGRGPLGFVVYILTMACNEIPLILSVVFATSVAATLTDVTPEDGQGTAVALGLALLLVLGLVWLQVRARSVRPAFEAALTMGLGPDWRARIPSESGEPFRRNALWSSGILLPFQRHRRTVERVRHVPYAVGGRAHLLDIYRRKDRGTGQQPVLIHLHSGGFVSGGKSRESVALLNQLADHGWFCVSANYTLRSAGAFP
jgi:acetyl esterase/lipase